MYLLQALGQGGAGLAHGHQFRRRLVTGRSLALCANRHGHQCDQRFSGWRLVLRQVVMQGLVDKRHDDVVGGGSCGTGHSLDPGQGNLAAAVAAFRRGGGVVEQRFRCGKGQGRSGRLQAQGLRPQLRHPGTDLEQVGGELAEAGQQALRLWPTRARARLRRRLQRHPDTVHSLVRGRGADALVEQFHCAHAVDHGVVDFYHDCELVIFEPLNDVALPQGQRAVEQGAVEEGDDL